MLSWPTLQRGLIPLRADQMAIGIGRLAIPIDDRRSDDCLAAAPREQKRERTRFPLLASFGTPGNAEQEDIYLTVLRKSLPGSAAATRTPTACCDSTSPEEPISRASPRPTSTRSPCGSINARERPWASKPQPIDCDWCCTDQLNSPRDAGPATAEIPRILGGAMCPDTG